MKIYKFRGLTSEIDFYQLKEIIETGYFWCSNFWDLNDPMEGVFSTYNVDIIDKIFKAKEQYKICSFSGENGFKNPTMWGYYCDGFKGVAIKVEIDNNKIEKVNYEDELLRDSDGAREILLKKLKKWKPENEFRFLVNSVNNFHKIGEIKAICFGDPYGNLENRGVFQEKVKKFTEYIDYQKKIKESADGVGVKCYYIKIQKGKVVIEKNL
jgi:hypothetical protein